MLFLDVPNGASTLTLLVIKCEILPGLCATISKCVASRYPLAGNMLLAHHTRLLHSAGYLIRKGSNKCVGCPALTPLSRGPPHRRYLEVGRRVLMCTVDVKAHLVPASATPPVRVQRSAIGSQPDTLPCRLRLAVRMIQPSVAANHRPAGGRR